MFRARLSIPTYGDGVIGNTTDSESVIEGSKPSLRAMKVNEFFDMIGWPSSELEDTEIGFWMLSDENNEEYFQNDVILYPEYNYLGCNTYKDLDIVAAPPAWEIV